VYHLTTDTGLDIEAATPSDVRAALRAEINIHSDNRPVGWAVSITGLPVQYVGNINVHPGDRDNTEFIDDTLHDLEQRLDPGDLYSDEMVGVERVAAVSELLKSAPIDLICRRRNGIDEDCDAVAALVGYADEDIARAQIVLTAANYAGWSPQPLSHLSPETRADLVELAGTYLATAFELIHLSRD
jgi:hypothetical protein